MSYRQTLGDWGEDLAAKLLGQAGFTDIVMLNDGRPNHPGGDLLASLQNTKYLFSVKARDRFMKSGAINWGYNIYPEKVIAASKRYEAVPAWLVVRADRRDNTACVFWGMISEIPASRNNPNCVHISMIDSATINYRCLAKDMLEVAIKDIFSDKGY